MLFEKPALWDQHRPDPSMEYDDNIEDGEDVTADEIDHAVTSTPMLSNAKAEPTSTSTVDTPSLKALSKFWNEFMPTFPAGRVPFIFAAFVAVASLSGLIVFHFFFSEGDLKVDESETSKVHQDATALGLRSSHQR